MQGHDLVNHGFDQCQRLLLVRVQGVGQLLHLPEMGKLPVLQHKLQGKGELGDSRNTRGQQRPPVTEALRAGVLLNPGFGLTEPQGQAGGHSCCSTVLGSL